MSNQDVTSMSPFKLAELRTKSKSKLMIMHKANPEAEQTIIYDSYPKDVAIAFFGLVANQFPTTTFTTLKQMQSIPTVVVIHGYYAAAVKKVFAWAIECCKGKGLQPYTAEPGPTFWKAHHELILAAHLVVPAYTSRINDYMKYRLKGTSLTKIEMQGLLADDTYLHYRLPAGIPVEELIVLLQIIGGIPGDATLSAVADWLAELRVTDMQAMEKVKQTAVSYAIRNNRKRTATRVNANTYPSNAYLSVREDFPTTFNLLVSKKIAELREIEKEGQE